MSQKLKPKIIFYDTYLTAIKNSSKTQIFRNLYAEIGQEKKDIAQNGQLSCAFFVSGILKIFDLVEKLCPTVHGLIKEMRSTDWQEIKKPKPGAILIWQAQKFPDGSIHKHAGFYLGNKKAISNSRQKGYPIIHHWTYGQRKGKPNRIIETIFWYNFWYKKLNKK